MFVEHKREGEAHVMTPQERRALWVADLRSGQYKQTRGQLIKLSNKTEPSYCAFGVFLKGVGMSDDDMYHYHGTQVYYTSAKACGLYGPCSIIAMNDAGVSFEALADTIESQPYVTTTHG